MTTLAGLMSRCSRPAACTAARAEPISRPSRTASAAVNGPLSSTCRSSVTPRTSSIHRPTRSSRRSMPWTATTCGWRMRASARPSAHSGERSAGTSAPGAPGRSSFSATSRRSPGSQARYTSACAPAPQSSSRSRSPQRGTSPVASGPGSMIDAPRCSSRLNRVMRSTSRKASTVRFSSVPPDARRRPSRRSRLRKPSRAIRRWGRVQRSWPIAFASLASARCTAMRVASRLGRAVIAAISA